MKSAKKHRSPWQAYALPIGLGIATAILNGPGHVPYPTFESVRETGKNAHIFVNNQVKKYGKPGFRAEFKEKEGDDTSSMFEKDAIRLRDQLPFARHMRAVANISVKNGRVMVKGMNTEVFRDAFLLLQTEGDFNSWLFDHENRHWDQLLSKVSLAMPNYMVGDFRQLFNVDRRDVDKLRCIYKDLDALDYQFNSGTYRSRFSDATRKSIVNCWHELHSALFEDTYTLPNLARYFESKYYRPWLAAFSDYSQEGNDAFYTGNGKKIRIMPLEEFFVEHSAR